MSVEWYEKLYIPIMQPSVSSKIIINVMDSDNFSASELAATLDFEVEDVINGRYSELFWAYLYGGPVNCSNDQALIMNAHPDIASNFRGRILLSLEVGSEETVKPISMVEPMPHDEDYEYFIMEHYEAGI